MLACCSVPALAVVRAEQRWHAAATDTLPSPHPLLSAEPGQVPEDRRCPFGCGWLPEAV